MMVFADEPSITVNKNSDIQTKQTKANTLTVSVLIPDAAAPPAVPLPSIRLFIPCGDDGDDEHYLAGLGDAGAITLRLDSGWRAGPWESVSDGLTCLLTYQPEHVEPLVAVSFDLMNVVSYAGGGIVEIALNLKNFPGAPREVYAALLVQKEDARLEILHFTPERPSILSGEKAALTWRSSGATAGAIVPGEFRLFDKSARFEKNLDAPEEFILTLHHPDESAQASAPVTMMPPHLAAFTFDAAEKKLAWSTVHAPRVQLDGEDVAAAGSVTVADAKTSALLALRGYGYRLDRELHFPAHPEATPLTRTIWWFPAYAVVRVAWRFAAAGPVTLRIDDPGQPDAQTVVRDAAGEWEFPYAGTVPKMTVAYKDFIDVFPKREAPND